MVDCEIGLHIGAVSQKMRLAGRNSAANHAGSK